MSADTTMSIDGPGFVPVKRPDAERLVLGTESVAWSPIRSMPVYLDPVANLLYEIFDGDASLADFVDDVVSAVGIDRATAEFQVSRVAQLLYAGGLLTDSLELEGQELPIDWLETAHDN